MKIDKLVNYCDKDIKKYAFSKVCDDCNHCIGCPGNCGKCIDQVHLSRGENERQDYDCPYMVEYYVCKYIYAYASEIGDCLKIIRDKILQLEHVHMLSIGAGPSPDLYALWKFKKDFGYNRPISYIGFEHNEYWEEVNNKTIDIFDGSDIRIQYFYEDAIETFKTKNLAKANILVLQYLLSHVVYNGREREIKSFFENLIENVILKMEKRSFILINDINHCLARDKFELLENLLERYGKRIRVHKYYYLFKDLNCYQRDGIMHDHTHIDLDYIIDDQLFNDYDTRDDCRSIQHIIEVF